ncbi:MAG: TonB-dependent receptor [Bacteroidales bacterium]
MKKFYLLLLSQFFCFLLFANNSDYAGFSIKGRIVDENGSPLVGATVVVENTLLGVSSGANGIFEINRLKKGSYVLSVSYLGYDTQKIPVDLANDENLNIKLISSALMCDEVVVSATRASSRMPLAQSTMSKEQISASNTGFDVPYLLEMQPSVVAMSEGGTGIGNTTLRIRGTDHTRINVTINGVPLNEAESQGVYWVDLPDFTASTDNVQVQRGVGTSTNGAAAFGASVNFQTTTLNPEPYAAIDLLGGSYNTWKTSARVGTGLIHGKFSLEARYSQLRSDGYIERAGSDHKSMFATAAWHGSKSLVRFNIIHGEEHTAITWEGNPDYMMNVDRRYNMAGEYVDANGVTRYYNDQKDNYWQTHYHLITSHSFNDNLTLNATLHLTDGEGYYEEYKSDRKYSKYGLPSLIVGEDTIKKSDFIQRKWMDNVFYGGITSLIYKKDALELTLGGGWNRYDGDHFGRIMWVANNAGLPKNYEWYSNNGLKTDWNAYAKSVWQVNRYLGVFADIQYRGVTYKLKGVDSDLFGLNQDHNWDFFNPKVGATFKFLSAHEVYASFGVANREPARDDLKDALKGTDNFIPKSERLYDWELGYRLKQQTFTVEANLYYMKYVDQLVKTGELTDVGYSVMENVPNSYRAGVELSIGFQPARWIKWEANTTLSKNEIEDYTNYATLTDHPDGDETGLTVPEDLGNTTISFSPSIIGASKLSIMPVNGLTLSWISKYVGKQYLDNTQSERRKLDAYWVNNAMVDYRFKLKSAKSIYIQGILNNFLNSKYEANAWVYRTLYQSGDPEYSGIYYYPQAEINFTLKLGVEF